MFLLWVECPVCGEELAFAVAVRVKKVAFINSDVQTKKEFFFEK
ncbi:hypothetical protein [Thermoanaerobacter sp. YS13]|nr:hypothetical protein [Thermoanaerobacter sp. YS13]